MSRSFLREKYFIKVLKIGVPLSYLWISKNMDTSEILAVWTYSGLQELHLQLQKFKNYFPQISNTSSRKPLSKRTRNILYGRSFSSVAFSINKLLAQDDSENKLSTDGQITLRTTLSNAYHFGAIILSHIYDPELLLILFDTKQHIDDIYSQYG